MVKANIETHHRSGDPEPVRITREIPLAWLIGTAFLLVVQAVTLYVGQQAQAEAIRVLSGEVKELRVLVQNGSVKDVEYGLRLDDHERRMQAVERRQAQYRAAERAAEQAAQSTPRATRRP